LLNSKITSKIEIIKNKNDTIRPHLYAGLQTAASRSVTWSICWKSFDWTPSWRHRLPVTECRLFEVTPTFCECIWQYGESTWHEPTTQTPTERFSVGPPWSLVPRISLSRLSLQPSKTVALDYRTWQRLISVLLAQHSSPWLLSC